MPYSIKIDNFEGPFDLLLHLIKKNKMDIYHVKIFEITDQYLASIEGMKQMDLEIASEFIVIAASLLEIKSRMLLPKYEEEESACELDPKEDLFQKLILYKKYKKAAQFLGGRQEGYTYYTKMPEIIEDDKKDKDFVINLTMLELYNVYINIMNKFYEKNNMNNTLPKEIPKDEYKIEDKIDELRSILKLKSNINFTRNLELCVNKNEAIVTFLALLELVKLKEICVHQENNFSNIFIERIESNGKE